MSQFGKISWGVSIVSLALVVLARVYFGGWIVWFWFPLGLFLASFFAALVLDFKFYKEFLTLRTTKHGMNMGVVILIFVSILISVNYLSVLKDQNLDLTEEKLFSLATESQDILDSFKKDVEFLVFYRGERDQQAKQQIKNQLSLYKDASDKVRVRYYDAFVEKQKANELLKSLNTNRPTIFVRYQGKRVRVEPPYNENSITKTLVRVSREGTKTVYFLSGHGENSLDSGEITGLKTLKAELQKSSLTVESINLLKEASVPGDADVLAIVGPKTQIQEGERQRIVEYLKTGGRLFVAADPGERHNLSQLLDDIGVDYKDNYVINTRVQIMGRGPAASVGLIFDPAHPITKQMAQSENFVLFDLASEVSAIENKNLEITPLVRTEPYTFTINELKSSIEQKPTRAVNLALHVQGVLDEGKEFAAVVAGDSDFVTEKDIYQGLNMDLALNSLAELAGETDLLTIRPKQPQKTQLSMTRTDGVTLVVAGFTLPVLLLISGFVVWFRRRGA